MALTACTWISDTIRRFRSITNPGKFPSTIDFTVAGNVWSPLNGNAWREFAIGESMIHQLVLDFNDDMYDQYILFNPALYQEPTSVPPCLWKIHIPDALNPIWASPPWVLDDGNGFVTYLGTELSAQNGDYLNCTVILIGAGTTRVTIQYGHLESKYMYGEALDVQEVNQDLLLRPKAVVLNPDPNVNHNSIGGTVYALSKWYFNFYIQALDTDDITIIPLNGANTAHFPEDATDGQLLLRGKYYNSNNGAALNPTLINPEFILERGGEVVTCLHLIDDTTFTFKLDFGAYIPKGAVAYLINTYEVDNTANPLTPYGIGANGNGYRVVLDTLGTGTIGKYFKAPMYEWTFDAGTVYQLSFQIDATKLVDIYQKYRMVIVAYSETDEVFNSFISDELSCCCECGVEVYEMDIRHIDCDHATGTVEVILDPTYDGVVDVDSLCGRPPEYTYVWSNGVTTYTSTTTPNITRLTAGTWTFQIFGVCSVELLFEYTVLIQNIVPAFDIAIIQPCLLGGTGSIEATITQWIEDWIAYTITLTPPVGPPVNMNSGVAVEDLPEGSYTVCVNAIIAREAIVFSVPEDVPEFDTPLADSNGDCTTCAPAIILAALYINLTVTNGNCDCGAVAIVEPTPEGVYTYLWSTGATTDSISGLCPGAYWVRVTNAEGCTKLEKFDVTAVAAPYPITEVVEPAWWPVPCNCSMCKTFITNLESKANEYISLVLPHMYDFTNKGYNAELFGKADCVDVNFNKTNDFIYLGIYLMLMEIDKAQYVLHDPDSLSPTNIYLRNTWFISCIEKYFKCHNVNINSLLNVFNAEEEDGPVDEYIASTQKKRPYPPYTPGG